MALKKKDESYDSLAREESLKKERKKRFLQPFQLNLLSKKNLKIFLRKWGSAGLPV